MTSRWRWLLGLGALSICLTTVLPLIGDASKGSMTAYVVQVVSLTTFVAPLAALALKRPSSLQRGRSMILGLIDPLAALLCFNSLFIYWFLPAGHRAITDGGVAYAVSLISIFIAGTWLWQPLIRAFSEPPSPMVRLGYILLVTVPQTFVGITMALTHPNYAVAGSILALASKSSLFVAFAILFARLMRESGLETDDGEDDGAAPEVPPPDDLPNWVTAIETGPTTDEPSPVPRPVAAPRSRHVRSPERRSARPRSRPRQPTGD